MRKKERAVRSSSSRKTEARAASERKRKVGRWFQGGPFCQSFLRIACTHNWLRKFFYHWVQEKSKTNNYLLVIIANARYYAQLLRNRPVESDSTGNRTYYETLKISLVLEPSSPEQSARVDTLVVDSATRPFIPRATLPLDRSTARSSPFASKRPVASFVRVRRLFTTKRYISFPQTIDIFFPHKGTIYLFLIFSRASRFFGGPRRLFHRRSSSFPSRGRTRARTRRRDGSFDEKSILSSKVKKHHT